MKKHFFKKSISLFLTICTLLSAFSFNAFAVSEKSDQDNNPFFKYDLSWDNIISGKGGALPDQDLDTSYTYIVSFKQETSLQAIFNCLDGMKYNQLAKSEARLFAVEVPDMQSFLNDYDSIISRCEKDKESKLKQVANDYYFDSQWAIDALNIDEAWDITQGSSVKVAVIDTGIYRNHEDFVGVTIESGYDFVANKAYVDTDVVGHGTMVSSVICAKKNNNKGIAGTSDLVKLVPIKVSDKESIEVSNSIKAIRFAADSGCKIINMSYGGSDYTAAENDAVQYAISKGCILIASAGNEASYIKTYPACYNNVISVGAVNERLSRALFSNQNGVDFVAPGTNITVATNDGGYRKVSGTSFSAPYVSGIAALALSINSSLNSSKFEAILKMTSTDISDPGYDVGTGYGLVNAQQVVYRSDKMIVTGVSDGATYYTSVKPSFSSSYKAILDGQKYVPETEISAKGKHLLTITDGKEIYSLYFTLTSQPVDKIEYYITGEQQSGYYYTDVTVNFANCKALLNGLPIQNGYVAKQTGLYSLEFYDENGYSRKDCFRILKESVDTLNLIGGVKEGGVYYGETAVYVLGNEIKINEIPLEEAKTKYGVKVSDDGRIIFIQSGKYTLSLKYKDISHSVTFTIKNDTSEIIRYNNSYAYSKYDSANNVIYSIEYGGSTPVSIIVYDSKTLQLINKISTGLQYASDNTQYISDKYIVVHSFSNEKQIKYMLLSDLRAGKKELKTINYTYSNPMIPIVYNDRLYIRSTTEVNRLYLFTYYIYDLNTGNLINTCNTGESQIYAVNEKYEVLYFIKPTGLGTRTLEYRDINTNLLSSVYVDAIQSLSYADDGAPIINGTRYSPTSATIVETGLPYVNPKSIGFIGELEIRYDGIYKDGMKIKNAYFHYDPYSQNDIIIGKDNSIYFLNKDFIRVYDNASLSNEPLTFETVCKMLRLSDACPVSVTQPFNMNGGNIGVNLQKNIRELRWQIDEKNKLIYAFVEMSYGQNQILVFSMNDMTLKTSYGFDQFGITNFYKAHIVNGYLCVFTDSTLNIYDPINMKLVKQYTDSNIYSMGFSRDSTLIKGNVIISCSGSIKAINIETGKYFSKYSLQSAAAISDEGRYIYYLYYDYNGIGVIGCYDFETSKIAYENKQNFSRNSMSADKLFIVDDYLILNGKAFSKNNGNYEFDFLDDILLVKGNIVVTKTTIYDFKNDIYAENNMFRYINYSSLYLSDSNEFYFYDSNVYNMVKTQKIGSGSIIPEVKNVVDGEIYIGSVTPVFENAVAYLDGTVINSSYKITSVGSHTIILISPIGTSTAIHFTIENAKFTALSFAKEQITLKKGQNFNLELNSAVNVNSLIFSCDNDNISIKSDGIIVAYKSGTTTLTAKTVNGKYIATLKVTISNEDIFNQSGTVSNLTFDGVYVKGIKLNQSVTELKNMLNSNITVDKIATGGKLNYNGKQYVIIIKGDVNGDGKLNSTDFLLVKKAYLGTYKLDGAYLQAACVSGGTKPNSNDFLRIKRHFLGTYNLYN